MNYSNYKKMRLENLKKRLAKNEEVKISFKEGKISLKEFNEEFDCEKFAFRVDFSGVVNPTSNGVEFGKLFRLNGNYYYVTSGACYLGNSVVTTYKICFYTMNGIITASYCYDSLKLRGNIEEIYDVEGMKIQWNNSSDYGKKKLKRLWGIIFHYRTPFINIADFINKLEQNS